MSNEFANVVDLVRDQMAEDSAQYTEIMRRLAGNRGHDVTTAAALARFNCAEAEGTAAAYEELEDFDPSELADIDAYLLAREYAYLADTTPLAGTSVSFWFQRGFELSDLAAYLPTDANKLPLQYTAYRKVGDGTLKYTHPDATLRLQLGFHEIQMPGVRTAGQLHQLLNALTEPAQEDTNG